MSEHSVPTITREQRDAIREWLVYCLSAATEMFGEILTDDDYTEQANDYLEDIDHGIAVMHVLGWSREDPRESYELTLPPQQLERLLEAMKEHAQTELFGHVIGWNLEPKKDYKRAKIIARAWADIFLFQTRNS